MKRRFKQRNKQSHNSVAESMIYKRTKQNIYTKFRLFYQFGVRQIATCRLLTHRLVSGIPCTVMHTHAPLRRTLIRKCQSLYRPPPPPPRTSSENGRPNRSVFTNNTRGTNLSIQMSFSSDTKRCFNIFFCFIVHILNFNSVFSEICSQKGKGNRGHLNYYLLPKTYHQITTVAFGNFLTLNTCCALQMRGFISNDCIYSVNTTNGET